MKRVHNCSQQLSDEDLEQLLPTLLLHLVDRCGGEVVFTTSDVQSTQSCLSEKMIQMLVGDDIRLRIITRPPEMHMLTRVSIRSSFQIRPPVVQQSTSLQR